MSLVVNNIKRSFGSVDAVCGVSFEVQAGTVFGLLGPNGAGKTTTMRIILGIQEPDSGTVAWNGTEINAKQRKNFGYLPEERGLYPKMRVSDQIAYFGRLQGLSSRAAGEQTKAWLQRLSISDLGKRMCGELSKGNQQKVQLATALVHSPELVILDEPFSGLDPLNAETMLQCIQEVSAAGTTVVVSSHQMFQIEQACSNFLILGKGRIRVQGTLSDLRATFPTRTVRVSPDHPSIRSVFAKHGYPEPTSITGDGISYTMDARTDFKALMAEVVQTGIVDTFERREPSLDQIYKRALLETHTLPEIEHDLVATPA